MSEKTDQSQTQTLDKKDQQETQNLSEREKPKELEIEELIPGLPKFEKIYENKDIKHNSKMKNNQAIYIKKKHE